MNQVHRRRRTKLSSPEYRVKIHEQQPESRGRRHGLNPMISFRGLTQLAVEKRIRDVL